MLRKKSSFYRRLLVASASDHVIAFHLLDHHNPRAGEIPHSEEEIQEELERQGFERRIGP